MGGVARAGPGEYFLASSGIFESGQLPGPLWPDTLDTGEGSAAPAPIPVFTHKNSSLGTMIP